MMKTDSTIDLKRTNNSVGDNAFNNYYHYYSNQQYITYVHTHACMCDYTQIYTTINTNGHQCC